MQGLFLITKVKDCIILKIALAKISSAKLLESALAQYN